MSKKLVLLEKHDNFVVITINRAEKRNAMNTQAQIELQRALEDIKGKYSVAIITGLGTAFCSGIDLKERREKLEKGKLAPEYSRGGNSWLETIEMIRKHPAVFIAAVNGYALGGGVSLINVCDLAVASKRAEIGMPEISFASYPTVAGPSTQLRLLRKHAAWLILTGKRINGSTAKDWGLVNEVVSKEELMKRAKEIAQKIAEYNPVTLDWSKKALDEIPSHVSDWTAALEYGRAVTSVIQNQIGKDKVTPKKF